MNARELLNVRRYRAYRFYALAASFLVFLEDLGRNDWINVAIWGAGLVFLSRLAWSDQRDRKTTHHRHQEESA